MTHLEAILLGLVQGLTEFLPVSSSGHLVLGKHLLGIDSPGASFEIYAHFGTLLAILVHYRREVGAMIASDRLFEPFNDGMTTFAHGYTWGGHPVAAATAMANLDVFEREGINDHVKNTAPAFRATLERLLDLPIVGDVRGEGFFYGIELVKDKATKEPFDEAGKRVYQKAFRKGLAWIPAGHILRMSPPVVMDDDVLLKGLDIIDEAIGETERELA